MMLTIHNIHTRHLHAIRLVPDFRSGKSRIQQFLRNPAKSGSGQISSWIWQMPVQLPDVQLITGKANARDLSSGVFTILICITQMKKYQIHCHSTNFVKNWQTVT